LGSIVVHAEQPAKSPSTVEIDQLVQQLADTSFPVRQKASTRLKAIGLDALPALQKAAESPDPEVRQRAWRLIDGWAAEGKVPALLFQLSGEGGTSRANAAENLGKLGAAAKPAIPALTVAAQDKSDIIRCCAREALKNIQSVAEITVEVVNL